VSVLAGLYAAGVAARNALYDRGTLPSRRLRKPVISVGNVAVGGAGKTPFVMLLGELLAKRGIKCDVLTRGYGRATRGVAVVDPEGAAQQFGDEPLLIARRLKVPVIVGEDRYAAGVEAEKRFDSDLHLLDDAFQHRALARDFDIVLVTPEDARDRVLPAGRLREPLSALARADAVVLSAGAEPESFPLAGKRVWRARRGIIPPRGAPQRPVVFCGIARPQNFLLQLRKAGIEPAAEASFRDHYAYSDRDIRELLTVHEKSEADGFMTTEKDAVNLGPLATQLDPLCVVPLRMTLENADAALGEMLRVIGERRKGITTKGTKEHEGVLP
jgi:tetraacyldisaccharide 4'-kinase